MVSGLELSREACVVSGEMMNGTPTPELSTMIRGRTIFIHTPFWCRGAIHYPAAHHTCLIMASTIMVSTNLDNLEEPNS
jgi:hypothetical protein